jgi:hydrogenase/urease accessory protein HupE
MVMHGVEIAGAADFLSYSMSFITATLLLHSAGMMMCHHFSGHKVKPLC